MKLKNSSPYDALLYLVFRQRLLVTAAVGLLVTSHYLGSLVAAMANLTTYKLYVTHSEANDAAAFAMKFVFAGYLAFFIGLGLYSGPQLVS